MKTIKLSELLHQLHRYKDLYPGQDPEIIFTLVDYPPGLEHVKREAEFTLHTFELKCMETRTLVHIPSDSLFSERGPFLHIYYEMEYINHFEDFWQNTYFKQHEQKQSGLVNPSSCTYGNAGVELDSTGFSRKEREIANQYTDVFGVDGK